MRRIDMNIRYRMCAIFCVTRGRKKEGYGHITIESLIERFGINWESPINVLRDDGIIYGAVGFYYLTPRWKAMTPSEQMEEINKLYPRRYVNV